MHTYIDTHFIQTYIHKYICIFTYIHIYLYTYTLGFPSLHYALCNKDTKLLEYLLSCDNNPGNKPDLYLCRWVINSLSLSLSFSPTHTHTHTLSLSSLLSLSHTHTYAISLSLIFSLNRSYIISLSLYSKKKMNFFSYCLYLKVNERLYFSMSLCIIYFIIYFFINNSLPLVSLSLSLYTHTLTHTLSLFLSLSLFFFFFSLFFSLFLSLSLSHTHMYEYTHTKSLFLSFSPSPSQVGWENVNFYNNFIKKILYCNGRYTVLFLYMSV